MHGYKVWFSHKKHYKNSILNILTHGHPSKPWPNANPSMQIVHWSYTLNQVRIQSNPLQGLTLPASIWMNCVSCTIRLKSDLSTGLIRLSIIILEQSGNKTHDLWLIIMFFMTTYGYAKPPARRVIYPQKDYTKLFKLQYQSGIVGKTWHESPIIELVHFYGDNSKMCRDSSSDIDIN